MSHLFRTTFLALLLGTLVPNARAEYYAETGRTENREVSSDAIGQLTETSSPASAAQPESSEVPVAAVKADDLYYPAVENALVEGNLGRIAVQSEGVNTSLRTFAEVQVQQITGQTRFKMSDGRRMDPIFTILGMIYQQKAWLYAPILPVENAELAKRLGLDPKQHNRVSPVWVMKTPGARTLVLPVLSGAKSAGQELSSDEKKALDKFAMRLGTFLNLSSEFKLVPLMGEVKGEWLSPTHLTRPELIESPELRQRVAGLDREKGAYAATLALDAALRRAYDERKPEEVEPAVAALLQSVGTAPEYMDPFVRKLDYVNTAVHPFQKAALVSMLAFFGYVIYFVTVRRRRGGASSGPGANGEGSGGSGWSPVEEAQSAPVVSPAGGTALAFSGGAGVLAFEGGPAVTELPRPAAVLRPLGSANSGRQFTDPSAQANAEVAPGSKLAWSFAYGLQILAALIIFAGLGARFLIGGRMPVSNMYESIIFAMGGFALLSVVFEGVYRRGWIGAAAAFAGWGLMTLANSMPIHMRKVEPLVAVLKSVWLNYHVTSLLISYSAFLLAFVCGLLYFWKDLTGNRPGVLPRKEMFEYISYRAIQVGWPLLTLGIFLGAVWANTAWGSYWSWDPKETWALITWFTYTIYLHLRMIHGWSNRRAVGANMLGFAMVLITYYGVSYLPWFSGGMHSYAEPISK